MGGLKLRRLIALILAGLAVSPAACIRYRPRPLSAPKTAADFEARTLESRELGTFFREARGTEAWPPPAWDIKALTLAAIYYHPDMDVARAQWGVARAGRITAGERPNPVGSVLMGYNATTPVSEVTPWIPEAALELTIETAGKRGYRIAEARHLSEAARLNVLATAWSVHSRVRSAFLDTYAAKETAANLSRQLAIQEESLRILEAQLAAGEISPAVVAQGRIALDQTRLSALEAAGAKDRAQAVLASAVGVPGRALDGAVLSFEAFAVIRADIPPLEARRQALLHRADILGALAEYAASDAALRLEIAKQYPDINLTPDYQLDQTDSKWTLGLSLVLPILNRNRGPIREAEARRAETAARFQGLQAAVIGDVEAAVAAAQASAEKARAAEAMVVNLAREEASAKARFDVGEISKLEYLGVQLELAAAAQSRLEAVVRAQQAAGELEDALQSPLDLETWTFKAPDRTAAAPSKERSHD